MKIKLKINGEQKIFDVSPRKTLLDLLRENGYFSPKRGCSTGDCGACAVLVDGVSMNSCLLLVGKVDGCEVITTTSNMATIQESLVDSGAVQCGFCTPGIIISTIDLINRNPNPDKKNIKEALDGNLCRCTGYKKIIDGIFEGLKKIR